VTGRSGLQEGPAPCATRNLEDRTRSDPQIPTWVPRASGRCSAETCSSNPVHRVAPRFQRTPRRAARGGLSGGPPGTAARMTARLPELGATNLVTRGVRRRRVGAQTRIASGLSGSGMSLRTSLSESPEALEFRSVPSLRPADAGQGALRWTFRVSVAVCDATCRPNGGSRSRSAPPTSTAQDADVLDAYQPWGCRGRRPGRDVGRPRTPWGFHPGPPARG